jgi:hypothetical protein
VTPFLKVTGPEKPVHLTLCSADEQDAPVNLISFLKAIPDGRYRRGVRYPQWYLLLLAVLGILSGCRSSPVSQAECSAGLASATQQRGKSTFSQPCLFSRVSLDCNVFRSIERFPFLL